MADTFLLGTSAGNDALTLDLKFLYGQSQPESETGHQWHPRQNYFKIKILFINYIFFSFQELTSSLTLYPAMILLKVPISLNTWAELYIMVSSLHP